MTWVTNRPGPVRLIKFDALHKPKVYSVLVCSAVQNKTEEIMGCATSQLPLSGGSHRQRRHSSSANSSPPNNVTTPLPDNHHHHNDEKGNRTVALATNNVISQQQTQQALRIVRNPSNTDNRPSSGKLVFFNRWSINVLPWTAYNEKRLTQRNLLNWHTQIDGFVSYHADHCYDGHYNRGLSSTDNSPLLFLRFPVVLSYNLINSHRLFKQLLGVCEVQFTYIWIMCGKHRVSLDAKGYGTVVKRGNAS